MEDLTLTFAIGGDTYQVSLKPRKPQTGDNIARYVLSYRRSGNDSDVTVCNDDMGVSFLPGKVVNGMNAETNDDGNAVTVACGSGAIITCLALGYTPWNSRGEWVAARDYVYRSCLQAQRAAYFVGIENKDSHDNFRSYRRSDRSISMWDPFGYGLKQVNVDTGDLEAIWTPRGAVCLNIESLQGITLPKDSPILKRCGSTPDWGQGKLATRLAKKQ